MRGWRLEIGDGRALPSAAPQRLTTKLCILLLALCVMDGGCRRGAVGPVFDVPGLLGKNIDEVTASIRGATVTDGPLDPSQAPGAGLAQRNFRKKGQTLQVVYKTASKRVTAYQIDVDAKTGSVKDDDKDAFLQLGNLKASDPRFTLEFNEDPNKVFQFTGVKITPNPVPHTVTFQVTGSEFPCTVAYAVRSNNADVKNEKLLISPPWKTTEQISASPADDTDLILQLTPYTGEPYSLDRVPLPPHFTEKLQILVDDRLLRETTCTGFTTICSAQI